VNTGTEKSLPSWLPFVAGAFLVVQFAGLSAWQISRGLEKLEQRDAYAASGAFSRFTTGAEVRPYQALKTDGRLLNEQQFLLENIIINSHYGYYVLTPLELGPDEPLLMVNRGWIEKQGPVTDLSVLAERIYLAGGETEVRGRVGSLPRAGVRMGEAIPARDEWPQLAVYPMLADLEASLGRAVQPFVLLMDPEEDSGFLRQWAPEELSPGKHFGYALQWFAMGAVLAGLLVWNYRRKGDLND
jgi:surfeit locus 1 family protein